ncbi:DUF4434 domain-containing protein [Spongiactinospora rosea]|uniref:DUF4434 domain-containing protein n=1 Tax=Spongiactinospora rosea TaxID=2248750 RepID=A0A366M5B2_9ACTN|nr:DUF4434 domain-containing protein [Spongiactinospora rosea]RBQ21385.1 DUF4434 domain-containing protein [Spongiactinospora rosea]
MRWLTVLLGAAIIAAVAAVVIVIPKEPPARRTAERKAPAVPQASLFTDPCGTFDTGTRTPYAVTGYWLVPTSNECTWRKQLEAIHKVGGDTVIRLGTGLQPRYVDEEGRIMTKDMEVDSRYAPCEEDGLTCVQAAERDLKKINRANRITWTYVYRTDERFGDGVFRCPEVERSITIGKTVFHRLIAPQDGTDDAGCDFTKPRNYHLIIVAAAREDSLTQLLDLADRFHMRVFPALPLAPRNPAQPTKADPRHIGTLTTLTRRILQDYGRRHRDRSSLGGVYQPFELQMRQMRFDGGESDNDTLRVYAEQHNIVAQELPGKPILVSPYLDARRRVGFGATPKEVAAGFEALARTGVEIIAPQDSRGTGKVGLYWPDERDSPVDERLRPTVGETTYGTAYHGSTRDYYRAMAEARDRVAAEGHNVQLWANVEAFEPSGEQRCGAQGTRGATDKRRLDAAVTLTGRYVSKVISYMWSDFFTCGSPSLSQQIAADHDRPMAVDAIHKPRGIQDGLEIRGYNLANTRVNVTWEGLAAPKTVDARAAGWHDPTPLPGMPAGTETLWVPLDWRDVPQGEWLRVEVVSPDGRAAAEPLHVNAS